MLGQDFNTMSGTIHLDPSLVSILARVNLDYTPQDKKISSVLANDDLNQ